MGGGPIDGDTEVKYAIIGAITSEVVVSRISGAGGGGFVFTNKLIEYWSMFGIIAVGVPVSSNKDGAII